MIEAVGLDRRADREIGLQIEEVPDHRPEPEVTIIDSEYEYERYASRFHGIVEVLPATDMAKSPHTGRTAIDDKLDFYRSHPFTEFILVISQHRTEVEVHLLRTDGHWCSPATLADAGNVLDMPSIGSVCSLATIYKGVKLVPEGV